MIESRFYIKKLTLAEVGETKTHEKYIRLPNDFDFETFFQNSDYINGTVKQVDFEANDLSINNTQVSPISLKFVYYFNSNKEKRIPSLGSVFEEHNVKVGDVVCLESRTEKDNTSFFINFVEGDKTVLSNTSLYYTVSYKEPLTISQEDLKEAFHKYLSTPGLFKTQDKGEVYWKIITSGRSEILFLNELIYELFGINCSDIFAINKPEDAEALWKVVKSDPRNIQFQNMVCSAILSKYRDFLLLYNDSHSFSLEKFKLVNTISQLPLSEVLSKYAQYLTALRTKPFLLLAGISGTGKSRIVRELARSCYEVGSKEYTAHKPKNFEMIQVKPNWHDSTELLGYVSRISGTPEFVAGDFLRFIVKAWENLDTPYFLCLDEMNLAPVEQYFAEYLSVVESRKFEDGKIVTDPIIKPVDAEWYKKLVRELTKVESIQEDFVKDGISLPPNLFVVGTVNMDETTYSFSRKVLDRAMTIEMNEVDLNGGLQKNVSELGHIDSNCFKPVFVEGCDVYDDHKELCDKVIDYLTEVNNILEGTPFKIAYRTRNEFLVYAVNRQLLAEEGTITLNSALDEMTSMKILSRIEGDAAKTETVLKGLDKLLKDKGFDEKGISLSKIKEMQDKLMATDYCSFWS